MNSQACLWRTHTATQRHLEQLIDVELKTAAASPPRAKLTVVQTRGKLVLPVLYQCNLPDPAAPRAPQVEIRCPVGLTVTLISGARLERRNSGTTVASLTAPVPGKSVRLTVLSRATLSRNFILGCRRGHNFCTIDCSRLPC